MTGVGYCWKRVVEASARARDLVARILAFSRSSDIERKLEPAADIVQDAVELLRATLPKTIELSVSIDPHTGFIEADRAQIQTVILNLASNAADAMGGKVGHLDIELKPRRLGTPLLSEHGSLPAGDFAELIVRDDGPGISDRILARIFEPFFTTKSVGEGTGLGLAMVHGIIIEHGGTINVTSRLGKGTEFQILIPLKEQEEQEAIHQHA